MPDRRSCLLGALEDEVPAVCAAASEALDRLDAVAGIALVKRRGGVLARPEWVGLLRSLEGSRDEECLRLAVHALEHREEEVRLAALGLAASFRDWRATPRIASRLSDASPLVRARAAEVLGGLGDRRVAAEVSTLLEDPDCRVVAEAATALGLLGHVNAEEKLVSLVKAEDPDVRAAAAAALGRIGFSRSAGGPPADRSGG